MYIYSNSVHVAGLQVEFPKCIKEMGWGLKNNVDRKILEKKYCEKKF